MSGIGVGMSSGDLARISREIRKAGNSAEVKKELRQGLRRAAKPLVPAVKASIAAIPSHSSDQPSLRKRMQKATKLTVRTGGAQAQVAVRVDGRKMPDKQKSLPAYMEGTKPRWRHPVWGNRNVWVQQDAHPYFYEAVRSGGAKAKSEVADVLDSIARKIS